ncbi:TPA: hypothetical protein ACJCCX_001182 [Acinetobacter baumannii]|nr:hypothetical protein [Acinetobacter baumannii]
MDAGLQIYNADGVLQLDTNAPILCLRYKYVFTKATYKNPYYVLDFKAHRPIVAFYAAVTPSVPAEYRAFIYSFYLKDNGDGTWRCAFTTSAPYDGFEINVYIFDLASAIDTPVNNYGLQVFDANEKLIYHTDYNPLRMVYFSKPGDSTYTNPYTGPGGINGWASQNDLHPEWFVTPPPNATGIKCAVVYTTGRFGYQDDGGDQEDIDEVLVLRDDQTSLSYQYSGGPGGASGGGVGTYLHFIYPPYLWFVDVSNY